MSQIPVCGMKFDKVVAGFNRSLGCLGKSPGDLLDLRNRHPVGSPWKVFPEGLGTRSPWLPSALLLGDQTVAIPRARSAGFSTGVGKLDSRNGTMRFEKLRDLSKRFNLPILPESGAIRSDPPARLNCRGLGDDKARSANCHAPKMHEMPVICIAVLRTILAHRRDPDSVANGDAADGQGIK